ncbi:MAG: right-handed parallel beta-helix repeat-containing protein [Bacteroidia bacterium]|nr:right-handed parallel beta-helix repeat-containing protein [Bacteroidia bacterium]MBP9847369.1 right-handed parallel beta-helix repeat-containing protein [Saprospiraceae bacterium]
MKKIILFNILVWTSLVSNAQTTITGGSVSGQWTRANSPYHIEGSIVIPEDSTLTIEPGVTINFNGTFKLLVLGRILAIGTVTDTIIFTASDTTSGWRGIRFENTLATNDTSKFIYCKLQYGKAKSPSMGANGGAFYFYKFSKAIISNSRISNCSADTYGAGICCHTSSSPVITNNTISFNRSSNSGGGVTCYSSNPTLTNNIISNNSASQEGGGIFCAYTNSTITKNTISNNYANSGGGIYSNSSSPSIINNIISNNTAYQGGGFSIVSGGSPVITNNIISNNSGTNGGGVYFNQGFNTIITNCTISRNSAIKGGGIYCSSNASPTLNNSILWNNYAGASLQQLYLYDEGSDPKFYYCDVQGGSDSFELNFNIYLGTYQNNINSDPLFVSPSAGNGTNFNGVTADWSLQVGSSCINMGNPNGTYVSNDIAGNLRVAGGRIDIGAFESQGTTSINNSDNNSDIVLYPNPSSGKFFLQNEIENSYIVEIYNLLGEKIYIQNFSGSELEEIDISNSSKGIYFVKILTKQNSHTERIVVR